MALPQGINFRATAGYVTDPTGTTYQTATTANYPFTTPQGNNVGWEAALVGGTRDRSTTVNARLAGINYTAASATAKKYRFDLPAAGSYNVRVAMGDAGSSNGAYCQLFDNVTLLSTLVTDHTGTGAAGNFYDATDTLLTAAAWPGSNTAYAATFASTIARFSIAPAAGGGATGTLAATESGTDTGVFSGSLLAQGAIAATEAARDTAAFAGTALAQGTLASTETGSDTAAFTGSAIETGTGTLAATESGTDAAAFTGTLLSQGSIAATESAVDTAAFSASAQVQGALAAVETGSDTAAFFSAEQISTRFGISYEGYTAKRPGHRTRSVVKKKVIQAAAKVAALAETVDNYEQNKTRYRGLMLEKLNHPVWTAEFERIIQIQLELQEEEDLIALLI